MQIIQNLNPHFYSPPPASSTINIVSHSIDDAHYSQIEFYTHFAKSMVSFENQIIIALGTQWNLESRSYKDQCYREGEGEKIAFCISQGLCISG